MTEPTLPLDASPPPRGKPPREGPCESADSRRVGLVVEVFEERVELHAWCRVGVWTTLDRVEARDFVVRESWGRLGERKPRRLARIEDQVLGGIVARLKPERDGGLSFVVEVARAKVGRSRKVGEYHGREIELREVERYGYRFEGRAPAGWRAEIARWGPGVTVHLGGARAVLPGFLRFSGGGFSGFVAGAAPAAEAFIEIWEPVEPVPFRADGVERMDYRLERRRRAAGFRRGGRQVYGAEFCFGVDG